MGKSSRIVLLTITSVLAIFVFGAMWVVKPSEEGSVLSAARERQNTPLVSVAEPLKTDVKALSEEEEFELKVRNLLTEDPEFINKLTNSIKTSMLEDEAFVKQIESKVDDVVLSRVDERVKYYVSIYESELNSLLESYKKEITTNVNSKLESALEINSLVDRLIEPVTVAVYEDFAAKEGFDIDTVTSIVLEKISSDKDIFTQDVLKVVYEEIDAALSEVDERNSEILNDVKALLESQKTSVDEASVRAIVNEVVSAKQEEIVVDVVERVLANIDSLVTDKVQNYVDQKVPASPVIITEPIVKAPKLENMAVSEAEFVSVRANTREEAIKNVLKNLK